MSKVIKVPDVKMLDAVKIVPLASLVADEHNARKHNEKNLEAIEASLKAFGQVKPVIIRNGMIIAGHGFVQVAKSQGWKNIAVMEFLGSEEQARAYAIADNRTCDLSQFDVSELSSQLECMPIEWQIGFPDIDLQAIHEKAQFEADNPAEPQTEATGKQQDSIRCPECGHTFTAKPKA